MIRFAMRYVLPALACVCLLSSTCSFAQKLVLAEANRLKLAGRFKEASLLLTAALNAKPASDPERKEFEFEIDRLERIKKDFPHTKEKLFTELRKSVRGLTIA